MPLSGGKLKEDEENFNEAVAAGTKINPPQIPSALQDLMASPDADLANGSTEPFWYAQTYSRVGITNTHRLMAFRKFLKGSGWFVYCLPTTKWGSKVHRCGVGKASISAVLGARKPLRKCVDLRSPWRGWDLERGPPHPPPPP